MIGPPKLAVGKVYKPPAFGELTYSVGCTKFAPEPLVNLCRERRGSPLNFGVSNCRPNSPRKSFVPPLVTTLITPPVAAAEFGVKTARFDLHFLNELRRNGVISI